MRTRIRAGSLVLINRCAYIIMTIINIISSKVINKEAFKMYISQNSKMLSAVVS